MKEHFPVLTRIIGKLQREPRTDKIAHDEASTSLGQEITVAPKYDGAYGRIWEASAVYDGVCYRALSHSKTEAIGKIKSKISSEMKKKAHLSQKPETYRI